MKIDSRLRQSYQQKINTKKARKMRLYSGNSKQFIKDTTQNQIADKLENAFFSYYRYKPSPNEKNS